MPCPSLWIYLFPLFSLFPDVLRLHVSTMSRGTIFVLSPSAGMLYRKSLPGTSCALHNGDPTIPPQHSTSSTSLSLRRTCTRSAHWSLLITSLSRELCFLQTVAGFTFDHTVLHFTSTECPDWGTVTPFYGSVRLFCFSD